LFCLPRNIYCLLCDEFDGHRALHKNLIRHCRLDQKLGFVTDSGAVEISMHVDMCERNYQRQQTFTHLLTHSPA